eukprot:c22167_g1_i1.p1 GENE.c22167_g1_i1~~c22167_g1_i1.p1  ORF type:complete len:500 (+),score=148.28 c22167_g1_i1:18-1517(+)
MGGNESAYEKTEEFSRFNQTQKDALKLNFGVHKKKEFLDANDLSRVSLMNVELAKLVISTFSLTSSNSLTFLDFILLVTKFSKTDIYSDQGLQYIYRIFAVSERLKSQAQARTTQTQAHSSIRNYHQIQLQQHNEDMKQRISKETFESILKLIHNSFLSNHNLLNKKDDGNNKTAFITKMSRVAFDPSLDHKFSFTQKSQLNDSTDTTPLLTHIDLDRFIFWANTVGHCFVDYFSRLIRNCAETNPSFHRVLPYLDKQYPLKKIQNFNISDNPKISFDFPCESILSNEAIWFLSHKLIDNGCFIQWNILYRSPFEGKSLNQLFSRVQRLGPFVIVIRDSKGFIFGGFVSETMKKLPDFYGDPSCFLFTIEPKLHIFESSGMNTNFFYFNLGTKTLPNGMGMGGQFGHFGWWIEGTCHTGKSEAALTYKNSCLSSEASFDVDWIEVWGCDIRQAESDDEDEKGVDKVLNKEDKFLLDLAGRTGYRENLGNIDEPEQGQST